MDSWSWQHSWRKGYHRWIAFGNHRQTDQVCWPSVVYFAVEDWPSAAVVVVVVAAVAEG